MEYIDCIVAGEKWGISSRRVQHFCKNKAIEGETKTLIQIVEKKFDLQMRDDGILNIVKIGIAFCGK